MSTKKQKRKSANQAKYPNLKFKVAILLAAIVVVSGGFALRRLYLQRQQKQTLLVSISRLDFAGVEPQVVRKITELRDAVVNHPKSAEAWGKLAMNLDAHDFKKESIPVYKEAAALDPSDVRWPYFCAIVLSQTGDPQSLDWFERSRKVKPEYPPLLINYANALSRFDRMDEAVEKYKQALGYDATNSHAFLGLAQVSFAKGDMGTSRMNLEKALQANPSHRDAYHLLGTVCKQLKHTDCATQAAESARNTPEKMPMVDSIYAEVTVEGESSLWYRFRGSEYLKKGMHDQAIREFQRAIQLRRDTQTEEDLAKAFNAAGKFPDAERQYRAIIAAHPTPNNYFGLALANARMGSFAEAEEFFHKAIEQKPDFAEAHFNLAVVFAKTGRLKETIASLKEATNINSRYSEAHYHLGLAYLAAQDRASALNQYSILTHIDQSLAVRLRNLIDQRSKP